MHFLVCLPILAEKKREHSCHSDRFRLNLLHFFSATVSLLVAVKQHLSHFRPIVLVHFWDAPTSTNDSLSAAQPPMVTKPLDPEIAKRIQVLRSPPALSRSHVLILPSICQM